MCGMLVSEDDLGTEDTVSAYQVQRKLRPTGPWVAEEGLSEISPELRADAAAAVIQGNRIAGWTRYRLVRLPGPYEACLHAEAS